MQFRPGISRGTARNPQSPNFLTADRSIGEAQAADLRSRLKTFAED
jgi:hypothetical protein